MGDALHERLEEFRLRMNARLAELRELDEMSRGARATVELDQAAVGRISRMDAMQNQQIAAATGRRRQLEIARLQTALQRIEADEFGDCLRCEEQIDLRRLEVDPSVTLCIDCARD